MDKNRALRIISIFIAIILFCLWQNNAITTRKINYKNIKIPKEFDGYKIVQVSDLHNKKFGKNQRLLLNKIKKASPDIIIVTGDLIDRRKYDLDTAMVFVRGAMEIAPVYYVSGNHESWSGDYTNIKGQLMGCGVKILDDDKVGLTKEGGTIELLGLSDPDFLTNHYLEGTNTLQLQQHLNRLVDDSVFQILLSHRPELFDLYAKGNIDLIFSGHAHGGQFRIPYLGGLIAPDQGLFPKYTSGPYIQDGSTLIVSRGLGNSIIPIRIFNKPEIIAVTLVS